MSKLSSRMRRARKARAKISELRAHRLSVHRTGQHIYAQVIDPTGSVVIASASTMDKEIRGSIDGCKSNMSAATVVGTAIAERTKAAGIETVAFDRSGFKYHGRVKALAEAAREAGLQF